MSDMQWYPVRCCCTPQKIFGFIQLPVGIRRHQIRLRVDLPSTASFDFAEIKPIAVMDNSKAEIEVRGISVEYNREFAVYSDDRPIEFWRRVIGFVEIKTDTPP